MQIPSDQYLFMYQFGGMGGEGGLLIARDNATHCSEIKQYFSNAKKRDKKIDAVGGRNFAREL